VQTDDQALGPASAPPSTPPSTPESTPPSTPESTPPSASPTVPHVPGSAVPAEAVPVQGRRAGVVSRVLADTVDALVVVAALTAGYLGFAAVKFLWKSWAFTWPTPSFLLMLVLGAVTAVAYLTVTWSTTGRSYGKHLIGLRVVGPFGRLGVPGAFVRATFCVAFAIGIFWVAVSRENRSVQDVVLRTSVIYDWLGGHDVPSPAERAARRG